MTQETRVSSVPMDILSSFWFWQAPPEPDLLAHHVLRARQEIDGQQLDELILHVLDEVQPGAAVAHHDQHRQVRVRRLYARVHPPGSLTTTPRTEIRA